MLTRSLDLSMEMNKVSAVSSLSIIRSHFICFPSRLVYVFSVYCFFVVVLIALLYTQSKSMYRVIISNSLLLHRPSSTYFISSFIVSEFSLSRRPCETISINTLEPCLYQMITESCLPSIHSLNMFSRIFSNALNS